MPADRATCSPGSRSRCRSASRRSSASCSRNCRRGAAEMAEHEDLLAQGPREAPEPLTAEERTFRNGRRALGGGVLGGGAAAAELGAVAGLGKVFIWLFA